MRRLLAVAVAVAMVAGALAVRQWLDDRGGGDAGGQAGGGGDGGTPLLVCATELAAACEAAEGEGIEVRVEPAGTTAAALLAGEVDLDGWLTVSPWPAIVREARQRSGGPAVLASSDLGPLARSPLVIVAVEERVAVLRAHCQTDDVYWGCIGDVAGRRWADIGGETTWGDVRPGHDAPDTGAVGLAVLGSAVADFFGTASISSADFEDDAFRSWFTRLERAVPTFRPRFGSLLEDLLLAPGSFDAVGTIEAEAEGLLGRSGARGERLTILYPAAMTTADAVLALRTGGDRTRVVAAVEGAGARALADGGWRAGDAAVGGDGLPPAGVLDALRRVWGEVRR